MNYIMQKNKSPVRLIDDFDTFMNTIFDQPSARNSVRTTVVDVREENDRYILEAELPGITQKEVDVKVEENLLTISTSPSDPKDQKKDYLVRERKTQQFKRVFVLPKDADPQNIKGACKNGLLTLQIEKRPEQKPRTIKVKGD